MAASTKGSSGAKPPARVKSPDALAKPSKRGDIELSEEDLKKVAGGVLFTDKDKD